MEKTYKFRLAFGDGKPIEVQMKARSGALAWELVRKDHPCAKGIHILGVLDDQKESLDEIPIQRPDLVVKHPLFD
jgi:hypothetical protein